MAFSSAIFTSFFSPKAGTLLNPSPSSSCLLPASPSPATVRMWRTVTCATVSSQQQERRPRGIMKPRPVSPEMAEFVGASEIPRTQALKRIWAYIKEHNLQDPNDKKIIICDEKLKKIFGGRDRVGFLEIAGLISPHFLK
ncbi:zinc finger CCCH domain-containing protein 44 [Manihot esculenta]|uniref:Uncharacterized protein n=3 Tax=Manihot esculenta TaxID=3983 RepID=A0ACB7GZ92_MANES|nr:zinc finger CCCH domain-containing protein 44 [Manihot esculenta]KAG8645550.1 hypothetical protein MANES_10G072700v8 [Manihot esculenta]KAG8645551.1 hypothetical protein MANES_10G072700v8 [Manihot esculenta]OAY39173.1 hypothetical protein MANES_10G072700v8 [Manihot esculenta]